MTIDELNENLGTWYELLQYAREYHVPDLEARAKYNIDTLLLLGQLRDYTVVEIDGVKQFATAV